MCFVCNFYSDMDNIKDKHWWKILEVTCEYSDQAVKKQMSRVNQKSAEFI